MELAEIRREIDRVDRQIRTLFEERMELADRVACLKAETGDDIYKPDREKEIIANRTRGMNPSILQEYTAVIKKIMGVSREYQYGRVLELGTAFPHLYRRILPDIRKIAVVREDRDAFEGFSAEILTLDDFDQVTDAVIRDEADVGVSRGDISTWPELISMLMDKDLKIMDCPVREDGELFQKFLCFSKDLFVLPDHNRILIAFSCPDRAGSLAAILSIIADYGVNLTAFYSGPFHMEKKRDNLFYAELSACMDQAEIRALIFQLSRETDFFRIAGSYRSI